MILLSDPQRKTRGMMKTFVTYVSHSVSFFFYFFFFSYWGSPLSPRKVIGVYMLSER